MENKILTAKEFLNNKGITGIQANTISNWMIEFAKLHVQEAINCAFVKIKTDAMKDFGSEVPDCWNDDSILNAYNLDNIK